MKIIVFAFLLFAAGCASKPIDVTYHLDDYGVPTPIVDGIIYPLTDQEREAIGRAFIDAYCR